MATTPATPPVLEVPAQRHRIPLGYWLLLPGGLWLALFFIVPLYSLVATSLYDPGGGAIAGVAAVRSGVAEEVVRHHVIAVHEGRHRQRVVPRQGRGGREAALRAAVRACPLPIRAG